MKRLKSRLSTHGRKVELSSFQSSYLQMITLGGDAELELVDSMDPFAEGIVFSVRPPKKSWKNICNLSGGEKVRGEREGEGGGGREREGG